MRPRAEQILRFFAEFLVHAEGDYHGRPFVLRPWQRDLLVALYAEVAGRRKYNRALIGLPKGNGKTELAAGIALFELFTGESPVIPVVAASYEQADLVFGAARTMVREGPLSSLAEAYDKEIRLREAPGRLYRVAAIAGTNDGQRPTAVIIDELHELVDAKERVHLILTNGLAKRADGLEVSITTAGVAGSESLCERLYKLGKSGADPRFFFHWREASGGYTLADEEERRRAVLEANPAAGDFLSVDNVVRRYDEIPEAEFRRYYLNQWTESSEAWEVAQIWPSLRDASAGPDPALPLFVAVDVGVKHDSSAVAWAQRQGETIVLRSRIWENPYPASHPLHATWRFAIAALEDELRALREAFPKPARRNERGRLLAGPAFFYDPHFFERSAQDLSDSGLNMIEYPQLDSHMVPASQGFFELAKQGRVVHDGDPGLARHVRNVVAEQKPRGWRIAKAKATRKVDGAVAAAIACHEAAREEAAPRRPAVFVLHS